MLSSTLRKRQRQEEILLSFETLKFATRDQLQKIHNLKSDRNALKVLKEMKEFFNIQVFNGMNVYYLNKEGREVIGATQELKWTSQAEHHILRNDMYVFFNKPYDWRVEHEIIFKPKGMVNTERRIIADASFTQMGRLHLLEVDRTQSMLDNKKKIDSYAELNPLLYDRFGHTPLLIFYTTTPLRKKTLKDYCFSKGLDCKIYTKDDVK